MGGLFSFIAIVVLFVMVMNLRGRLKRAEDILAEAAKRIGALQREAGLLPPSEIDKNAASTAATAGFGRATQPPVESTPPAPPPVTPAPIVEPIQPRTPQPPSTPAPTDHERWKPVPVVGAPPATEMAPVAEVAATAPTPPRVSPDASTPVPVPMTAAIADPPRRAAFGMGTPVLAQPAGASSVPPPPSSPVPPPPVPPAEPPASAASRFENLFGKTLPIWAGGITLAIAGVLIVKYAVDAGFFARIFTHGVQIGAGLLFGLGLIGGAEFAWRNDDKVRDLRVPQALSGAGIATLYASILVAANVYMLIGPLLAFVALAAITAGALGLSLRFGAPSALLGLAGGLAAPALVGSMEPNVPLLAVYLGLTIAGLTGVSRMRRWPWLGLAALVGGVGWSLWMVLASNALDVLGSLSIGGFVMLLAIALPMMAFDGPRANVLRAGSALIGAVQLALLVGYGGFIPLHWGLFAMLAAAGQWLAWRNRDFAIVPTISAALSVMLLAVWPDPLPFWFALIGLSLAVIHAGPLLLRLWQEPPSLQRTLELCGIVVAAPVLTKWHYVDAIDSVVALIALGGAAVAAAGVMSGWRVADRQTDSRFAWLASSSAALIAAAIVLILPHWIAPLGIGVVAAGLLYFGKAADDHRLEPVAAGFVGVALAALLTTVAAPVELSRLWIDVSGPFAFEGVLRWTAMAGLLGLFAAKAVNQRLRFAALALAGAFSFGALAQIVPNWSLPLAMAGVAAALLALAQWRKSAVVERLSGIFAVAAVLWLLMTGPELVAQWSRLIGSDAVIGMTPIWRWGGLAALWAIFAWRARGERLQLAAHGYAAVLAYGLLAQIVPAWSLPLALAAVAAAVMLVGERGGVAGVRQLAVGLAVATLPVLFISSASSAAEWSRVYGGDAPVTILSAVRWGGLALLALLYAGRSSALAVQRSAQIAVAGLTYVTAAQLVPGSYVMLVPAVGGAMTLVSARRLALGRIAYAAATFALLSLAWAFAPVAVWVTIATASLAGAPMWFDGFAPMIEPVVLRLLAPTLLLGGAVLVIRDRLSERVVRLAGIVGGITGGIAVHCLYRVGFAQVAGDSFVAVGLSERLLWTALLLAGGWLALKRNQQRIALSLALAGTAHLLWYSQLLHGPLWAAQAVGVWPVINLLAPLFGLAWLGLVLVGRALPNRGPWFDRGFQLMTMVLIGGFAWATLRQLYHGTLLVEPGVLPTENILRSILILGLAIGFLLWGIRTRRHDWRIASLVLMLGAVAKVFLFDASGLEGLLRIGSFIALGFSLIGIGWLYSRQLAGAQTDPIEATPET